LTGVEPPPATSVVQPVIDQTFFEVGAIETTGDGRNETMTNQPDSPLAGLSVERTIHLRWVLRDIKGGRTKLSPVSPDDLRTLIEMGLVEMHDNLPHLTDEGHRALDWN
jgi:hypothetical protein